MKRLLGLLLALLVLALVAPAQAMTTVERRSAVPWDEVGDGWVLAEVQRGPIRHGEVRAKARSLELISPEGTRYSLYATSKDVEKGVDVNNFALVDWDPEARTALLKRFVNIDRSQVIRLDLESGSSQTLALPKQAMSTGLRPDGSGVLVQNLSGKVVSITWDGIRTTLGQASQGGATTTPDGTAVLVADPDHLTLIPLDGSATSEIATPGQCNPIRWYDDVQLLASCYSRKGSQLVTVGLDGTVTARASMRLTTSKTFHGPSWDDTDVRVVGGRSYYEGNGPCGGSFIIRENAAGEQKLVRVPGSTSGISIVDARDERLVIAHTATCDSGVPRAVLSTFDPISKDEDVLVTLARSEHWSSVQAWDEPRPWGY